MGDIGSGYLGFCLAVLALAAAQELSPVFNAWLILTSIFIVDATLTLIRRMLRGERVYEPHCIHAYQWMARRWRSHARVTATAIGINIFWLTPLAWAIPVESTLIQGTKWIGARATSHGRRACRRA